MSINGITAGYYPTGYEIRKKGKAVSENNFAKEQRYYAVSIWLRRFKGIYGVEEVLKFFGVTI